MVPPSARLSAIAVAAAVALYAATTVLPIGRRIDAAVVSRDLDFSWEWAAKLPAVTIRPTVVVVVLALLCWLALRDRRPGDAVRVVALTAGAAGLARVCEEALETLDPLGDEAARALGPGWYPSGHAAVAMSVALAALIVAPAAAHGRCLLMAAAAWPALAGWAIVSDAGHHPSDVVGGLLLATALGGLLVVGRRPLTRARSDLPWATIAVAVGVLLAACGLLAAFDGLQIAHSAFQPALILASTVIGVIALVLVRAFDRVLGAPKEEFS